VGSSENAVRAKFAESDFYVLGWVEGKEEGRVQGNPMSDSGKEKEPLGS